MDDILHLSLPGGLITKVKAGEFTLLTDYPQERGGTNIALNPWRIFLSAILSCQGVNLAKYCLEHKLDYQKIEISLIPLVQDNRKDEFPEYHLKVSLPPDFPAEHIEPMVAFFNDCPVANHLTKLKPILKTFVNERLISEMKR
ncbi:putative OsmC-like protein [Mesocricetibacter intestinalis]|uniref:Putative OsmC-like protein n=1 Tax=Mesocricetibacter intestinalis TaxID=1521930 RepID=A0A4R6V6Y1_9PAST|nr:OsmC family protein [Mesocricetibacter intestinalis]TDQ57013.1 putative OsmC-like protein [Mesocricetibacter intestinalis]